MKYEHRSQRLIPFKEFILRLIRTAAIAALIVLSALMIGVLGYHFLEGFSWIDSLLNASMILGGMGPIGEMHTFDGKLFASAYALFSGIVFLTVAAVLFAPVVHRLLHRFHFDMEEETERNEAGRSRSGSGNRR